MSCATVVAAGDEAMGDLRERARALLARNIANVETTPCGPSTRR
jgi:hypothetical protein